jgi:hypothetical protein
VKRQKRAPASPRRSAPSRKVAARRSPRAGRADTYTIFTVTPQDIGALDATRAVDVISDLLWAELRRLGVPTTRVNISRRINVPDGGVDASVAPLGEVWRDSFLFEGLTAVQIKAGDTFKPWHKSAIQEELFGTQQPSRATLAPGVRELLEKDGTYILLCTGTDPTDPEHDRAVGHLNKFFASCGFPEADVEVWGQTHLIGLLQRFPSLALKVNGNGGADFLTHDSWATQAEMRRAFNKGPKQDTFIESVSGELRRSDGPVHVRVRGEAGIGKTRLTLETTNAEDLKPLVIYCAGPAKLLGGELLTILLRPDSPVEAIVVVDECDAASQANIWNQLQEHSPRIKLVSIYNDPDESSGTTVIQDAPVLDDSQISAIIEGYGIPKDQAQRWAELCGGSPRVGHVIGQNLKNNPDDLLRQPDTVKVWDRYVAGDDAVNSPAANDRRSVLEHVALFKRFGYGFAVVAEARAIAALVQEATPAITWVRFEEIVAELKGKRILQGENTLYITPRLLHIKLWADWWDKHPHTDIKTLTTNLPTKLQDWFFEMFRYARESEAALRVTRTLLDENGPFGRFGFFEDGRVTRFFRALTDAAPQAALRTLQRTIGRMDVDQLRKFEGDPRRQVVWSLEAIAIWRDHFAEAARLLLKLAEAENEKFANNATGVFADLFSPGHGPVAPTEASLEERFPVLREALESPSQKQRDVALLACERALATGFFSRMMGPEHQGLRHPPELWVPKTWGEVFDGYRRVWELMIARMAALDVDQRNRAASILAGASRGLLLMANIFDMVVDGLSSVASAYPDTRRTIVEAVEVSLHYDGKALPRDHKRKLEDLRAKLVDSDFRSQLERYVGMDPVQDHFDDDGKYVEDKHGQRVIALAQQALASPDLLFKELPWLLSDGVKNAYRFGLELGNIDSSFLLLPKLVEQQQRLAASNAFFLSGYFAAVFQRNETLWEATLELMATDEVLLNQVTEITWRSGMTEQAALRILTLLTSGRIPPSSLRMFSYGGVVRKIPEHVFSQWIDFLIEDGSSTAAATALNLFQFYYLMGEPKRPLPHDLTLRVVTAAALFEASDEPSHLQREDYDWAELANAFLNTYPNDGMQIAERLVSTFGEKGTLTSTFHGNAQDVLSRITKQSPLEVWRLVAELLGPPIDVRAHRLRGWLRDGGIQWIPPEAVWKWIDGDIEKRAWYAATFVPSALFRSEGQICWARELLVRYGDREDVRRNLHANFGTEFWSGPASQHYAAKKKGLEDFRANEKDRNVLRWLDESIDSLTYRIEAERVNEEREF